MWRASRASISAPAPGSSKPMTSRAARTPWRARPSPAPSSATPSSARHGWSGAAEALQRKMLARLDRETLRRSSWQSLLAEGAVQRLLVSRGDAAKLLGTKDNEPDKPFIDLWLALATPPPIGESLLGQRIYESELAKIGPDDDLVLIGATGLYSFKGTEWRRSNSFNRIEIVQGGRTIRLKPADHTADRSAAGGGRARTARDRGVSHRAGERLRFDQAVPARSRSRHSGSRGRPGGGVAGLPHPRPLSDRAGGCAGNGTSPTRPRSPRRPRPAKRRYGRISGGPAATKSRCSAPCSPFSAAS